MASEARQAVEKTVIQKLQDAVLERALAYALANERWDLEWKRAGTDGYEAGDLLAHAACVGRNDAEAALTRAASELLAHVLHEREKPKTKPSENGNPAYRYGPGAPCADESDRDARGLDVLR